MLGNCRLGYIKKLGSLSKIQTTADSKKGINSKIQHKSSF